MDDQFGTLVSQGLEKAREDALPEAAELLTQAVALRPADAEAWNSLGVVLVRQGQMARGADAFARALRLAPNHAEAQRNLAVVLDRQGRSQAAAAHYRAFLRDSGDDHPARVDVRRRLEQISSGNVPMEEGAAVGGDANGSGRRASGVAREASIDERARGASGSR
jgi:Flp pilus assembly protein TadD